MIVLGAGSGTCTLNRHEIMISQTIKRQLVYILVGSRKLRLLFLMLSLERARGGGGVGVPAMALVIDCLAMLQLGVTVASPEGPSPEFRRGVQGFRFGEELECRVWGLQFLCRKQERLEPCSEAMSLQSEGGGVRH